MKIYIFNIYFDPAISKRSFENHRPITKKAGRDDTPPAFALQ